MSITLNKRINRFFLTGQLIEIIWTIMPAIILLFIALPSLRLLYLLDEINNPLITLKTIGHQWYWRYELSNFHNTEFDSFIKKNFNELNNRLLDVDNNLILPNNTQIRNLVSAADVLHSWTIPSLGIKIDATPGRLNQINFFITRNGNYYGQCSEICGANHSFIPILLERTPMKNFIKWLNNL